MKALFSDHSERQPLAQNLNQVPERRSYNIFKGWEHRARGGMGKAEVFVTQVYFSTVC